MSAIRSSKCLGMSCRRLASLSAKCTPTSNDEVGFRRVQRGHRSNSLLFLLISRPVAGQGHLGFGVGLRSTFASTTLASSLGFGALWSRCAMRTCSMSLATFDRWFAANGRPRCPFELFSQLEDTISGSSLVLRHDVILVDGTSFFSSRADAATLPPCFGVLISSHPR